MGSERDGKEPLPAASQARSAWSFVLGLVLSLLWPGLGHFALGRWRRGALLALLPFPFLAAAAHWIPASPVAVLALFVRPHMLLTFGLLDAATAVYRAAVLLDVWRLQRRDARVRPRDAARRHRVALGLLLVLLLAPHLASGYLLFRWYRFLQVTFPDSARVVARAGTPTSVPVLALATSTEPAPPDETASAEPQPQWPRASTPLATATALPAPPPMASLVPSPVPTAMPPAAPVDPLAPALADGRLVVLLVGTDAGPGRWSARADTIIVAALDVHTGRAVLIGVPRNFTRLPLPPELAADYPQGYWPDIANALYTAGLRVPERFPGAVDPGAAVLAGSLAQLLGLPIDYTAAVDMGGFVQLIDALGGVTVDVAEPIATWLSPPFPGEDWRYYEIAPGRQHLDGHAALAYVRSRTGSSDYDRMQRQRCLLGALVREAERPSTLARLPAVLDAVQGSLRTDVPREALPWLLELGARVEPERIAVLGLVPPDYVAGWAPGGYPIPDGERIRHDIAALLAGSALPADSPLALPRACRWSE